MTAALLHVLNHAAFKTLLFLGAGSVLRATGLRDLDELGGLRVPDAGHHRLRSALGALAAAALPPGNGVRQRVAAAAGPDPRLAAPAASTTALVMPIAVAAVALTAGLAVATFVKAFGVGFLARPRTRAGRGRPWSARAPCWPGWAAGRGDRPAGPRAVAARDRAGPRRGRAGPRRNRRSAAPARGWR